MLGQVKVGAVGNAPQLAPAEGEEVLNVGGGVGVVAQLFRIVVPQLQVFVLHAQAQQEVVAVLLPVGKPFQIGAGLAEEFHLHLFKFPGAEGEVAGGDFVAEGLADLADAEGQLLPGGALDVGKVYKDALGGFGTKVDFTLGVLGDTLEGFEHQVELPDVGKVALAAVGAFDLVIPDVIHHLLVAPAGGIFPGLLFNDLVGAVAGLALLAVDQRVGETTHVAGSHPNLRIHQQSGVQAHIVPGLLDKLLPPGFFHIVFEFHTQRAVVPGVGQTAVDLAAGIDKAPVLAEVDDHFHGLFGVLH